ncbi:MAG: hypothetical protein MUF33_04430 [Candidatus Nanopelagicales bacterium]|jgi:hypothetical protein|nr:hypothetical protein [Candidatus Nanopelagicales bacterium]
MPFMHGSKAKVFLNGRDVSGFVRSVSAASELDTASVDVMGGTYKQSVTGLLGANVNLQGYIDGAAGASDELFGPAGAFQSTNYAYLLYAPQGNVEGSFGYGYAAWPNSYEMTTDVGDAGSFSWGAMSDVGLERGRLVHAYEAEGAGGTNPSVSTGFDDGAATTAGGSAYLMVGASAASLAVTLSSATTTNGTYTTFATFSTTSVAYNQQRLVIAPTTINQFVRCVWTGTGTFAVLFHRN